MQQPIPDYDLIDTPGDIVVAKPWWQSRAVWGGLTAAAAGVGAMFGVHIDQGQTLEILMQGVAALGGLLAVYGRVKATKPIHRRASRATQPPPPAAGEIVPPNCRRHRDRQQAVGERGAKQS